MSIINTLQNILSLLLVRVLGGCSVNLHVTNNEQKFRSNQLKLSNVAPLSVHLLLGHFGYGVIKGDNFVTIFFKNGLFQTL